jgi:hypothetical protein
MSKTRTPLPPQYGGVLFCGSSSRAINDERRKWANKNYILNGADYLESLTGKYCRVGAGRRHCSQLWCQANSAIMLCNPSVDEELSIPCPELAQYARYMVANCMVGEIGIEAGLWVTNHPGKRDFFMTLVWPMQDCWG